VFPAYAFESFKQSIGYDDEEGLCGEIGDDAGSEEQLRSRDIMGGRGRIPWTISWLGT
jgi:hypothetical protein